MNYSSITPKLGTMMKRPPMMIPLFDRVPGRALEPPKLELTVAVATELFVDGGSGACQQNRDFGIHFVQFREYFQNNFSETKNSRKQELALWHLVNRLVT